MTFDQSELQMIVVCPSCGVRVSVSPHLEQFDIAYGEVNDVKFIYFEFECPSCGILEDIDFK